MSDRNSIAWKMLAQQPPLPWQGTKNPFDRRLTPEEYGRLSQEELDMYEAVERRRLNEEAEKSGRTDMLPLEGAAPGRRFIPPNKPVTIEQTDLPDLPLRTPPQEVPMSAVMQPVQVAAAREYEPGWEWQDVLGGRWGPV